MPKMEGPRKLGYCQRWKLGYCRRWKLGYCQRWKLGDKEVQTWAGRVFAFLSAGADTKANTLGAAAYFRLEIFVSLRTVESLEAPSAPILL